MKFKKPDLSKPAMKKFFLHHTEKLILGLCVVLLGVFFWMGFKAKPFSDQTPDQLAQLADDANRYIVSDTSWDSIKEFRKGDDGVLKRIKDAEGTLVAEQFKTDSVIGSVAKTLDQRRDPKILGIESPEVNVVRSSLIFNFGRENPFSKLPLVAASTAGAGGGFGGGGLGGGPSGGLGGGEEDDEEPEDDDGFDPGAGAGGGRGAGPGGFGAGGGDKKDDELPEMEGVGDQWHVVNAETFPGVRPVVHQISSGNPVIYDVVCVTGLVDFKSQWNSFQNSLSSGMGFYPDRDKPIYRYLEVMRREVGKENWTDISELINYRVAKLHPTMHMMPNAMFPSAPEVVHAENFDSTISQPIPAFTMFDYTSFANHSKLERRQFPAPEAKEEVDDFNPEDAFSNNDDAGGNAFGGGQGRGGLGGPGLGAGGLGGGGLGGGRGGSGAMEGEEVKQTRAGNDFTDYVKALESKKEPKKQYRLVRFFDVQVTQGKTYEYKMRAWVADPNNEDPNGGFAGGGGLGGGGLGGGRGRGGLGGGMGGPGLGGGLGGPGLGGAGQDDEADDFEGSEDGEDGEDGEKPTKPAEYVSITSPMKHPLVRRRLNQAESIDDPKNKGKKVYFVFEAKGDLVDGKQEWEKIQVPNDSGRDLSFLRYCRPSAWTTTEPIEIKTNNSQVAAGKLIPAKQVRMSNKKFNQGFPQVEVVASVWDAKLGTAIPTNKTVFPGDLLDFYTNARVLNPITRRIHVATNPEKSVANEGKYIVPIKTGTTVVDIVGGNELPLPSAEKIRHHLASEVLVLDENGEFQIRNDMADRSSYINNLFLVDEKSEFGKPRRPRKEPDTGFGGGLGGGRGGGLGGGGLGGGPGADDQ